MLEKPELPVDSSFGRRMMDIVSTAATHMSDDKLDILVKTSLRVNIFFCTFFTKIFRQKFFSSDLRLLELLLRQF